MTLIESLHAERKERLARMNGPRPVAQSVDMAKDIADLRSIIEGLTGQVASLVEQLTSHGEIIAKYLIKETDEKPRFGEIMDSVCEYYHVSVTDVVSSRKTGELIVPRQMTCYLGRHMTGLSFPQMGRRLGGRDHTTALHAANRMLHLMESDDQLRKDAEAIMTAIAVRVLKRRNERLVQ